MNRLIAMYCFVKRDIARVAYSFFLLAGMILAILSPLPAEASQITGSSDGLKVYHVEPFDFVYPTTVFKESPINGISLAMARNEYEPVTFAVISSRDYHNVTLQVEEPADANGHHIRRNNIDVRVVKVWRQSGTSTLPGREVLVPELLMKDDTVPIVDSFENGRYVPPSLPSAFRTAFHAGQVKQIWITVHTTVSENPAGLYNGKIKLLSEGRVIKAIGMAVRVLPITLPGPSKRYCIYFRGRIEPSHEEYLDKALYMKEVKDIREHGFDGITIYDEKFDQIAEGIDRAAAAGLKYVVVIGFGPARPEIVNRIIQHARAKGMGIYFYGADEPNNDERLMSHIRKSKIIHEGGGKVVTAITRARYVVLMDRRSRIYEKLPGTYEPLDWANYHLKASINYIDGLVRGVNAKGSNLETYYWQISQENPIMHRLYSGYYLWRTGLDGVFPYCYQSYSPVSPYNGGDKFWRKNRYARVLDTTYPSMEGPVPTLQWEAIRAGINDVRYLTLLASLSPSGRLPGSIEKILTGFGYIGFDNDGAEAYRGSKFSFARERIIDAIMRAQESRAKSGSPAKHFAPQAKRQLPVK